MGLKNCIVWGSSSFVLFVCVCVCVCVWCECVCATCVLGRVGGRMGGRERGNWTV